MFTSLNVLYIIQKVLFVVKIYYFKDSNLSFYCLEEKDWHSFLPLSSQRLIYGQ